jgi:hypothetical protein
MEPKKTWNCMYTYIYIINACSVLLRALSNDATGEVDSRQIPVYKNMNGSIIRANKNKPSQQVLAGTLFFELSNVVDLPLLTPIKFVDLRDHSSSK